VLDDMAGKHWWPTLKFHHLNYYKITILFLQMVGTFEIRSRMVVADSEDQ
jgi:hypothetical protein